MKREGMNKKRSISIDRTEPVFEQLTHIFII